MQAFNFKYEEDALDVNNIVSTLYITIDGHDIPVDIDKVKVVGDYAMQFVDMYGEQWLLVGSPDELKYLCNLIRMISCAWLIQPSREDS